MNTEEVFLSIINRGIMNQREFMLEIAEKIFTLEIVKEKDESFFLFCRPHFEHRFFFISFLNNKWEIQNRDMVANYILAMEDLFNEKITERLKEIGIWD